MNPQTLRMHADQLDEIDAETIGLNDTRALLREAADALQAGLDLARSVKAALATPDANGVSRVYSATRLLLLARAQDVFGKPVLDVEPDDAPVPTKSSCFLHGDYVGMDCPKCLREPPRPGTPEAARRARNTTRHPAEWGEQE